MRAACAVDRPAPPAQSRREPIPSTPDPEVVMRTTLLCLLSCLALAPGATAHEPEQAAEPPAAEPAAAAAPADPALVASAMRAAPKKVADEATIVTMGADGAMRTLREGSNGFTCMPDNPQTPGPDPMCMDKAAMDWLMALLSKKPPAKGRIGLMYMLEGGTDASNTDPYATGPTADNHWIETGPHFMIVGADDAFYAAYPSGPDPDTDAPYVMWAGTPYQHLMAPVK
jgi:hypothetical protein